MKKYLISILFFSIPILIILFFFEISLRNVPNDYSLKQKFLKSQSNTIEKLILGSSHAFYGINPQWMKGRAFNAANVAQTIDYDNSILLKYKQNWHNLKFIILPIDYFTLVRRLSCEKQHRRNKNYSIYYNFHTSLIPKNYLELLNGKTEYNLNRLTNYYINDSSSITCNQLGYCKYNGTSLSLDSTGIAAAKRHSMNLDYFEDNLRDLETIIIFAQSIDAKVFLYTSPAYSTYIENLSTVQLDTTINSIKHVVKNNNNCIYYNFLEDSTFKKDHFWDADHLNFDGSKILTKKIEDIINNL